MSAFLPLELNQSELEIVSTNEFDDSLFSSLSLSNYGVLMVYNVFVYDTLHG
ncbi:hypothetical protein ACG2LH_11590 [Zhouia sp. PK063]|uniref:hypothetical protein n=1 Tax=Zhouia sp. PK063 TaxID=3373602 RepID=UPI00379B7FBB